MRISSRILSWAGMALLLPWSLPALNPVAYVLDVSGVYTCTDQQGTRTIAAKAPVYQDAVLTRTSAQGYIKLIDGHGAITPNLVDARVALHWDMEISPERQRSYLVYISGTMTRESKGATSNEFLAWMTDLGNILEADVASGRAALVFSLDSSSLETRSFFPLVLRLNPGFEVKSVTYRVVQSTLVSAEGTVPRQGNSFVLRLKDIPYQPDSPIPLVLTVNAVEKSTGLEKTLTLEAPYTVLADDGYIDRQIAKTAAALGQDVEPANSVVFDKMARLSVYSDYGMNLYALSLWAWP